MLPDITISFIIISIFYGIKAITKLITLASKQYKEQNCIEP